LGWSELKIVLSFIGAHILFLNAQRPAAMENMTLIEYKARQETADGRYCIRVAEHKTACTYGPVVLFISPKVLYLMECYYTHTRQKITPQAGCEEYLFLRDDGGKLNCITEIIIGVGKAYGCSLPNPTLHKKVVTTKAAGNDKLPQIRQHMTHSASVSRRHYLCTTMESHIEGQNEIEKITLEKTGHF